jgi:hypothetical protein
MLHSLKDTFAVATKYMILSFTGYKTDFSG